MFVAVNVLGVPPGQGDTLEQRFAARAGLVDKAPGFVSFELWRPTSGTDDYLVVTRWQDQPSYENWLQSRQFASGHAASAEGAGSPAANSSQIWLFETAVATSGEMGQE